MVYVMAKVNSELHCGQNDMLSFHRSSSLLSSYHVSPDLRSLTRLRLRNYLSSACNSYLSSSTSRLDFDQCVQFLPKMIVQLCFRSSLFKKNGSSLSIIYLIQIKYITPIDESVFCPLNVCAPTRKLTPTPKLMTPTSKLKSRHPRLILLRSKFCNVPMAHCWQYL